MNSSTHKHTLEDVEIDNRDSETTWLHFPDGNILEITRDDCVQLVWNMAENAVEVE